MYALSMMMYLSKVPINTQEELMFKLKHPYCTYQCVFGSWNSITTTYRM